jgi:hypothetical protein
MKRFLIIISILCAATPASYSQYIYSPCKDPLKIENIFYTCYEDYDPVCGCDGITYRNYCAAENQYALSSGNYTYGPCTSLDYDISPNQVLDILHLKVKKINRGYFSLTIYDVYGHIFFNQVFNYTADAAEHYQSFEIPVTGFEQGLYIIEIISDNEQQIKKFYKVNLN